jgi:alkylated DNA repair dioxygenase AlkB
MGAPVGFAYRSEFITDGEEAALIGGIAQVEFSTFEMRGVAAKRRVAFFGRSYDDAHVSAPPIPAFLEFLRERIARWTAVDPRDFAMALINEYRPGAPIGWHRDAPQYDLVVGVSLLSSCRMKFRPYLSPGDRTAPQRRMSSGEAVLERRSAYLLAGESRSRFEHHIPAVNALRYSITFRTLRR